MSVTDDRTLAPPGRPRARQRAALLHQFLRFAAVGACGTAVQYGVLWAGVEHGGAAPPVASAAGYLLGSVVNYLLNYFLTFGQQASHGHSAPRYAALLGVGWCLNTALMYLLVRQALWYYWSAQVVTTGLGLLWNFAGSRWWAFDSPGQRS